MQKLRFFKNYPIFILIWGSPTADPQARQARENPTPGAAWNVRIPRGYPGEVGGQAWNWLIHNPWDPDG